jgi:hypothetical protein
MIIEFSYVSLVAGVAITVSTCGVDIGEALGKAIEVAERIERMEQTPSPIYEHFPAPEQPNSRELAKPYISWH